MGWDKVKGAVAKVAPVAGTLLGGPAGGAVGGLIASALGVENSPEAVEAAIAQDPDAAVKLKELEQTHQRELERMALEAETTRLSQINKTMRAELDHDGWFKSGWRPGLGWVFSFSLAGLAVALISAVFREPTLVGDPEFSGTLIWLFVVMGGALGINVRQRSNDKALKAGAPKAGVLDYILKKRGD